MRSTIEENPFERCGVKCRQPETPEHTLRIGPNDFIRATARVDRKEDGDESPHDMGVAIGLEDEARAAPAVAPMTSVASQT
jgi:hypothetical protein